MNIKHIKKSIMAILLISIILLPLFATSITPVFAGGFPEIPHLFHGIVTINNELAVDGTIVSAKINDIEVSNTTTSNGTYTFSISGVAGNVISFYINGISANQQFNFIQSGTTTLDLSVIIPIESITVTPDATTLNVTDTQQFTATVLPESVHQSVVWSVDNETVGTINATGYFTANTTGNVTIIATSDIDSTITGTATITVVQLEMDWNPWNDADSEDGVVISLAEIVEAIGHWSNDEPVRGYTMTLEDIIELIGIWAAG